MKWVDIARIAHVCIILVAVFTFEISNNYALYIGMIVVSSLAIVGVIQQVILSKISKLEKNLL